MNEPFNFKANPLENMILSVKQKKIRLIYLIPKILMHDIYLVCDDNILTARNIILPLYVEIDKQNYICVFTNKAWANQYLSDKTATVLLEGREVFKLIPDKYGLILNPNHDACMKISPAGVLKILNDFT